MESEVNVWKAKLVDAMRKDDKLGSAERKKILPNIEDLHMLLEEMSDQVENLKTQCPSDWRPLKMRSKPAAPTCAVNSMRPWSILAMLSRFRCRADAARLAGSIPAKN